MNNESLIFSINDNSKLEDKSETILGLTPHSVFLPTELSFEFVEVSWDFSSNTSLVDWIGLFPVDELNPLLYLDYRSYGFFGQQNIKWKITSSCMPSTHQANVCFRYYSGLTGSIRASSPALLVFSDAQIVITAIKCRNVKTTKGTYSAKLSCGTVVYKTSQSNSPEWTELRYAFPADRSQELWLVIKERLWNGSRPFGEVNISIADIIHQKSRESAFTLRSTCGSQFNGEVVIQCQVTPSAQSTKEVKMNQNQRTPMTAVNEDDVNNGNLTINASSSIASSSYSTGMSMLSTSNRSSASTESITNLPKGKCHNCSWEVRVDRSTGLLVYIDHQNKRTTWNRPVILEREYAEEADRYGNARRTVLSSSDNQRNLNTLNNNNNDNASSLNATTQSNENALNFLRREDFMRILHKNDEALKMYNSSSFLKQILERLRKDRAQFEDFENNRLLVEFLSLFADTSMPLPANWELAKERGVKSPQKLFIDHNRKKITLIDPRLPVESPRNRNELSVRGVDMNRNLIYDIRHRCNEIERLVRGRFPDVAPDICQKLQNVCALGDVALRQYSNDADFVRAISVIDEASTSTTKSAFEENAEYFHSSLKRAGYGQGPNRLRLTLRRSHLMNDAFEKIMSVESSVLRKSKMIVSFAEEPGLDYHGISKELFFLLSRELFNPYYSLFEYSSNNSYNVQISSMSKFVDNHLRWMELCGRFLGLALIHRCQIDSFFTVVFYKMLLGLPYTMEDVQSIDTQFYNSLAWIRDNSITSDMDLTFSTTMEVGGEILETELVPEGKSILVTDSNKSEFLSLLTKWRVERNVSDQMQALLRGLYAVIDRDCLRILSSEQLKWILSGNLEIDLEDWRQNCDYKGGYFDGHVVINWFWMVVVEMTNADRLKLLQFVTGTTSQLRGSDGLKKFTIEKWGTSDSSLLPRAHTCFNKLDLPQYESLEQLKHKLLYAIHESRQFAIE
ncbi:E3 ubiquitin-protein ligase [Aphelenchoides besseyi]|nr:E3 ubiquitin-protein ligase [Aphelenchoides besseyi]